MSKKRWVSLIVTWFWFGDLTRIFGILRFDAVFIDSWLEFRKETGDSLLLLLLDRFWFFELFPFFFSNGFCDRAGFVAFGDGFGAWIAETIAHWWRFDRISESSYENSIDFGSSLLLKRFRVLWIVLGEFSVLILTAKREKMDSVCVMWREFYCCFLTCTVVAFYRLPCVHLDQLHCDIWIWVPAWQSGLLWLKDQNAILKTLRTEMQLKLGLKCNNKKYLDCFY